MRLFMFLCVVMVLPLRLDPCWRLAADAPFREGAQLSMMLAYLNYKSFEFDCRHASVVIDKNNIEY